MDAAEEPRPAPSQERLARPAAKGSWTLYKPLGREAPEKRDERRLRMTAAAFPLQRQHTGRQQAEAPLDRRTLMKTFLTWQQLLKPLQTSFPKEPEGLG